jgi:hypothetical protein
MKYITLFLLVFTLLVSFTGDVYGGFLSSLAEQLDALNNNMGQVGANIGANYEEGGLSGAFNGAMGDLGSANEANEEYRKTTIQEFKDDLKKIVSYIPNIVKKAWGKFIDFLAKIRDLFLCNSGNTPADNPPADNPPADNPPAEEATEVATEEPATEATEVATEEPAAETTDVATEEPAAEATEVATEEPAAEATEVATEEPAAETTEVATEEPAAETTDVATEEPAAETTDVATESNTPPASGTLKGFIKAFEAEPDFDKKLNHYIDQTVATEGMAGTISKSRITEEARIELSEKLMAVSEENTRMEESIASQISSSLNRGSHKELDTFIESTTKLSSTARKATAPLSDNISRILREKMMILEDKELLLNKLNVLENLK